MSEEKLTRFKITADIDPRAPLKRGQKFTLRVQAKISKLPEGMDRDALGEFGLDVWVIPSAGVYHRSSSSRKIEFLSGKDSGVVEFPMRVRLYDENNGSERLRMFFYINGRPSGKMAVSFNIQGS